MNIDLFKLNNYSRLDIDDIINIPSSFYEKLDIRDIKNVKVSGFLSISYDDELESNLDVSGTFILPCAITLEDVEYSFETKIEGILGKFDDFYNKNKNTLDILPFIWENIVSEVPIRVVKEGIDFHDIKGEGWELISSEES